MRTLLLSTVILLAACTDSGSKPTTPKDTGTNTAAPHPVTAAASPGRWYLHRNHLPAGFTLVRDQSAEALKVTSGPYVKHKGVHTGYRLWKGPGILVDSRWVFPSSAAAAGFFRDAEAINAEGLKRQPDPGLGDESRLYTGVVRHPTLTDLRLRSALCYVRQGAVVAKVFLAWEQRGETVVDKTPLLLSIVKSWLKK